MEERFDPLESREPIVADLGPRPVLAITFGGMRHGVGAPLFEFFRTLQSVDAARVFVRDYGQCWYHAGVPGHPGIAELAAHLGGLARGYRRVVTIGNSMGGYAALLFGWLLKADQVVAFTPQTCLERDFRVRIGDARWQDRIEALGALPQRREDLYDLRNLPRLPGGFGRAHVIYPEADRLDVLHAENVASLPRLQLTGRAAARGHQLAQEMRDSGELLALLRSALDPKP